MDYAVKSDSSTHSITLSGELTFDDHAKSKEIETLIRSQSAKVIQIDMSSLKFIDSMGLGMLILWKDAAEQSKININFVNPSEHILTNLRAGKMDEYLSIQV